ncbi:MAG: class I SAM-dependent DNA methyltransferase [Ilumatobacteraceae bacterium]
MPAVADELWGERVAARYDADLGEMYEPAVLGPTADFLADLAGDGRALEFAIGTGRVAFPLRERGVDVHGIELSQPMVDQLRRKPGGDAIPVTIGDMATTRVDGAFRLVYLVFNTITNLLTQEGQVDCFCNAAAHLEPGGRFVIEVGLPNLQRLPRGERFVPFEVTAEHLGIDEYELAEQRLVSHHYHVDGERVERIDSPHRYAWPAEYDLMARIAGMTLVERWADWHRTPFTNDSTTHVSVWQKPSDPPPA